MIFLGWTALNYIYLNIDHIIATVSYICGLALMWGMCILQEIIDRETDHDN